MVIQDEDHSWGGNVNHEVSYCLNPVEFADPFFPDPKQPDPNTTAESGTLVWIQPAVTEAGVTEHAHYRKRNPYYLYLLKRPPPALFPAV